MMLTSVAAQEFAINEAQAERGATLYADECATCHGADMAGGNAPGLKGGRFITHWEGKPLGELFDYIRENMPAGSPGSLHSDDYRDILADILRANGYPATAEAQLDRNTDLSAVMLEDKTK